MLNEIEKKVSLDIISGFLGAGKTTFVNKLLKFYQKKSLTPIYIVNEFGKIGLDSNIIEHEGFTSLEIEGGCVCCTLKDDVTSALKNVIKTYHPTNIVFEPSGIFIFDNFIDIMKDDFLSRTCEITNVITIIDSINYKKNPIISGSFIDNQIKNAQTLIISKLEKFSGNLPEIVCDLKNSNQLAQIVAKQWSELTDLDFQSIISNNNDLIAIKSNSHSHHIKLQTLTIENNLNFTDFNINSLKTKLQSRFFGDVIRVKGYLIKDNKIMLCNIVFDEVVLKDIKYSEDIRLTFIGHNLDINKINNLFQYIK